MYEKIEQVTTLKFCGILVYENVRKNDTKNETY